MSPYPAEQQRASKELAFTFPLDSIHELSGLPNRKALNGALDYAIDNHNLQGNFAALFVDLDGLKELNDVEGHGEGDKYLKFAGGALSDSIRPNDLPAVVTHLSGDEFVVLVAGVNNEESLNKIKDRLQTNLDDIGIPSSIGGKVHEPGETRGHLLSDIDKRMYEDKIRRKLERLSPEQREAYLTLGNFALEHSLSLRDASAVFDALKKEKSD